MSSLKLRPLHLCIAGALAFATLAPTVSAQTLTPSAREERAKRMEELGKGKADKAGKAEKEKPAAYPNAARVSPEAKPDKKALKRLQELQELNTKQDMTALVAKATELAEDSSAGAYERSVAYIMAANAEVQLADDAKSATYFGKAIENNGLSNDDHYNTMFNLAVIQSRLEKYPEALATLDRFLTETKTQLPEQQAFRAGLLANLGRNDEAAAVFKTLVAKSPDDKRLLMNAVATLQGAEKFDEANILLEDAYKRGMLTDGKELRSLYVGYIKANRLIDAKAVMDAGTSKGILSQDAQLAKDYMVLAQNAYGENNVPLAIEMYTKAGPIAADGTAYLNLAKVLSNSGKKAEAQAAAQKALDKGLTKPEEARSLLAR